MEKNILNPQSKIHPYNMGTQLGMGVVASGMANNMRAQYVTALMLLHAYPFPESRTLVWQDLWSAGMYDPSTNPNGWLIKKGFYTPLFVNQGGLRSVVSGITTTFSVTITETEFPSFNAAILVLEGNQEVNGPQHTTYIPTGNEIIFAIKVFNTQTKPVWKDYTLTWEVSAVSPSWYDPELPWDPIPAP